VGDERDAVAWYHRAMGTFGFRLRFFLHGTGVGTHSDLIEVPIDGHKIVLRAADAGASISAAKELELRGTGFPDRETAEAIGQRLKRALVRSGPKLHVGFDVGTDSPTSSIAAFIRQEALERGVQLLNDVHGLAVYCEEPAVRFFRTKAVLTATYPEAHFVDVLRSAYARDRVISPREKLALELYALAHREATPRAKFLTLVTVVEVLAGQGERSKEEIEVVDSLLAALAASAIREKASLRGALGNLKKKSIRRCCRDFVEGSIGNGRWKKFDECYELRSNLVHEGHATRDAVNNLLPTIEEIVTLLFDANEPTGMPA